jgi:hypothetical protein
MAFVKVRFAYLSVCLSASYVFVSSSFSAPCVFFDEQILPSAGQVSIQLNAYVLMHTNVRPLWTQIVACFVGTTGEGSSKRTNNIVFFDRKRLKDFVYGENLMRQGFLQRFVAPEAIPFDHTATNVTLHVTWSPYKCIVEQRVNKVKLNNKKFKTSDKVKANLVNAWHFDLFFFSDFLSCRSICHQLEWTQEISARTHVFTKKSTNSAVA